MSFQTPNFREVEGRLKSLPSLSPLTIHDIPTAKSALKTITDYKHQAETFEKRESSFYKLGVGSAASIAPIADMSLLGLPVFSVSSAFMTGHKRRKTLEARQRVVAAEECLEKLERFIGERMKVGGGRCVMDGTLVPVCSSSSIFA